MGGESEVAWRALLDDLIARGLKTPEFLIIDGAASARDPAGSFVAGAHPAGWGPERFRHIFARSVKACLDARITKGEIVHIGCLADPRRRELESLAVRYVAATSIYLSRPTPSPHLAPPDRRG
jgi:hypothetical protein